jgi:hypothetical protein
MKHFDFADYRNADSDLNKAMLGKDGRQDRWRFCVSDTDSVLVKHAYIVTCVMH